MREEKVAAILAVFVLFMDIAVAAGDFDGDGYGRDSLGFFQRTLR